MENSEFIDRLCSQVKKKKDLRVADSFVRDEAAEKIGKNLKLLSIVSKKSFDEIEKTKEYRAFFKELRSSLRNSYGMFVVGKHSKRNKAFENLLKNPCP
ncbi:MAG: hypothetical protein V1659_05225, partial [Candidatus Woesearchaeota archaeon]